VPVELGPPLTAEELAANNEHEEKIREVLKKANDTRHGTFTGKARSVFTSAGRVFAEHPSKGAAPRDPWSL
jgi:hypothetical protein